MRQNKLDLYVHLVWATWDRLPLIETRWERRLHRCISAQASQAGCPVLALGGVEDHIHLLVRLPATIAVATLVKQVKGASSHFVNAQIRPGVPFRWQGYYAAFSVSRWDLERITRYIERQKQHHAGAHVVEEWERAMDRGNEMDGDFR